MPAVGLPAYVFYDGKGNSVQFYAPTVVDTRREQAKEDAKQRMREMSRMSQWRR